MQCVATLQWASKVGNREKRVESSAWPLCSGLPMSAADCRAGRVQGKDSHRDARQSRRACRVQGGFSHRGARQNCRAGAPTRAIHALHSTLFSLLPTLQCASVEHGRVAVRVESRGKVHIRSHARQSCRACRVQGKDSHRGARQNCRAGAPARAIHALPSALFSLLSTLQCASIERGGMPRG